MLILDMTRLERWERAEKMNLNPPSKVKEIVLSDKEKYLHPIWNNHRILD